MIARRLASLLLLAAPFVAAQDTRYPPDGEVIPGPARPADFQDWLRQLRQWRHEKLIRMGYSGAEYDRAELRWAQRNFVQPQSMVEDRYFYDPVARRYTVDRFLDDLDKRYGGIDSVLLWPVYPNIGIDNRNQWDLHRDMPGGVAGLKRMIADFHRRGVRVFFPTMPWDVGTRDVGMPYWEAAAKLAAETGADGLNGDTFHGFPRAYRTASDATGHPVVLEPEVGFDSDEQLAWNTQSWGYWKYGFLPAVSRYKWLETRHMVNVCDRWARDKTNNLQFAFFNGVGYESWENIWGIWNQITPRDAEALRRIARILRRSAEFVVSPDWEPHTSTLQYGVYASRFPRAGETFWTVVNRNPYDVPGRQLAVPHRAGTRYFDLYHGVELEAPVENGKAVLAFPLEALGYGAVLATSSPAPDLAKFLAEMNALTARPLSSYSHEWKVLPQQMVPIRVTAKAGSAPPGMIAIPRGEFDFDVTGVEIEGGNEDGVGVQYGWEPSPRRRHSRHMTVAPFYIDRYPVTNAEFKKFLDAARYHPADDHNFLRDWTNGTYPEGWAKKPVTWVSLEDARAYAAWAGKRLPHEWEWQYAAQGTDHRTYPWGDTWDAAAVPEMDSGRDMRPPADVDSHPRGASPFGVMDTTGNVWQWTEEFVDEHTRAAILRGGSHYHPQGSNWYFPQAYRLNEHGKYLLIAPSKDRAGTLGFRCVADR